MPGSYDKCLAGIQRLVDRGVRVGLKTMALTWNVHEVRAMEAYATSLGLPFRFDSALNPRVDCGANRNGELQLTAERAFALDLVNPERMRELKAFCETFARPERPRDTEHVYTCGAGHSSFTVDPYGALLMCQLSPQEPVRHPRRGFRPGLGRALPEAARTEVADERGLPILQSPLAVQQLLGGGRDGDGRRRRDRAGLLRDGPSPGL